jgi:CubicO group peptidase (beta-lactamase class C family)
MKSYLGEILAGQPRPEVIGPLRDASGASGVVVHRGHLIAEWGAADAIEMSFSVSKSYLSLVAGVAFDRGLIRELREPVAARVDDEAFAAPAHRRITWEHLLYQTSEWGGTLWDRPWWSDPQGRQPPETVLAEPGTVWAYNDVRINLLALALTRLWGRPLAEILRAEVMQTVGASTTWQWHGYRNAWIAIDGVPTPVVSGGAHWGGGFWASAYDHARIGALYLRRGRWRDRQVLSERWIDMTTTPCALNADYGMLWWLNRRGKIFAPAPATGFCARGNLGRQLIWVDPARELVVVSRWSDDVGSLLAEISSAVDG